MVKSRHTPIIVGVADVTNRSKKVEDAHEPLQLILEAIQAAFQDTKLDLATAKELQSSVDSIDVVQPWTWPYTDLPGLIADRLAITPRRKHQSNHGGNQPALLVDEAARRIAKGQTKVAIITGGEALASLSACAAAGKLPPPSWTPVEQDVTNVFSPTTRELPTDLGSKHGIGNPIHVYPLYENSFRAYRNQSIKANNDESSGLYAEFAQVAAKQDYAWSAGKSALTKQDIGTISPKNRMICFPYPLLMNAFNTVNLAAACVLTSTKYATELGIPQDTWIYPLGGAGTKEPDHFWDRGEFWWSPAISRSLDAGLEASNLTKSDIDFYDFYSCFPIVPKLACEHLGISIMNPSKPITLLGGLTSFGGAGNNYSMHAITEMTRQIRQGRGKTGLILANGGVLSYQYAICISKSPRHDGLPYPDENPLPEVVNDIHVPMIAQEADGPAVVETYTVEFDRDGAPQRGFVVGRLKKNGDRFLANHANEDTLKQLSSMEHEPIGRSGRVKVVEGGKNLFQLDLSTAKL